MLKRPVSLQVMDAREAAAAAGHLHLHPIPSPSSSSGSSGSRLGARTSISFPPRPTVATAGRLHSIPSPSSSSGSSSGGLGPRGAPISFPPRPAAAVVGHLHPIPSSSSSLGSGSGQPGAPPSPSPPHPQGRRAASSPSPRRRQGRRHQANCNHIHPRRLRVIALQEHMGVNVCLVLVVDLCLTPSSCTEPSCKGEKGTCVAVQGRPEDEKKTSLFSAFFMS
ncbi:hypothetical protein PVAP13_9NG422056 [Panicum virgatum]|uniref:Uncharacterized protein n=1 Tax=Panicum virgatum TaxID=38727 RepID=A0A8T0MPV6_PANVG|nr:hypothetical protein PVAP13_9NG422056 [Panicum virgatum]